MNQRRAMLKQLAQSCAATWGRPMRALRGETRVETKNTIYQFRDGVCIAVTRRDGAWRADPTVFIGMRLVGWLAHGDPHAGLTDAWTPGAYALLFRARQDDETRSPIALTSATTAYAHAGRTSVPPPLPRPALQRPVTMTRVIPSPPRLPARDRPSYVSA